MGEAKEPSPSRSYRERLAGELRALRATGKDEQARRRLAEEHESPRYTLAQVLTREREETERLHWELDEAKVDPTYGHTISNEFSLFKLFPYLKDVKGAGLGVGFDQMLDIAANSQLEQVYIVDISEPTVLPTKALLEAGRRFHQLTKRYPTPRELIGLMSRRQLPYTLEMLKRSFTKEELAALRDTLSRDHVGYSLPYEDAPESARAEPALVEEYLTYKATQPEYRSWISTPENVAKIISMYESGRIVPIQANLAGSKAMEAIAKRLYIEQQPLSLVYLSNVLEHFKLHEQPQGPARLRFNLENMPIHQDTLFIQTEYGGTSPAALPSSFRDQARLRQAGVAVSWTYILSTFGDILKGQHGTYQSSHNIPLNLRSRAAMVAYDPQRANELGLSVPEPGIIVAGLKHQAR